MELFRSYIELPWTMVFCNTNECDANQGFLRNDDNRARSLVTLAVHRRAVDPSIAIVPHIAS